MNVQFDTSRLDKNPEFQRLMKEYVDAYMALSSYFNANILGLRLVPAAEAETEKEG